MFKIPALLWRMKCNNVVQFFSKQTKLSSFFFCASLLRRCKNKTTGYLYQILEQKQAYLLYCNDFKSPEASPVPFLEVEAHLEAAEEAVASYPQLHALEQHQVPLVQHLQMVVGPPSVPLVPLVYPL